MGDFISLILTVGVLILAVFYLRKRKKNQSKPPKTYLGCTLPALLFIIFVPIILAAIGIFFGSLVTTPAKSQATIAIHEGAFKKIAIELVKCKIGENSVFNNLKCDGITGAKVVSNIGSFGAVFNDRNPYDTSKWAVRASSNSSQDENVGFVNLSATSSGILLETCYIKPCSRVDNRLNDMIIEVRE